MKHILGIIFIFQLISCGGGSNSGAVKPKIEAASAGDAKVFSSYSKWCSSALVLDENGNGYAEEYILNENQDFTVIIRKQSDNSIDEELKGFWGIENKKLKLIAGGQSVTASYSISKDSNTDEVESIIVTYEGQEGNELWTPCETN